MAKFERLTGRNEFGEVTSYNPDTDYVAGDKEIRIRLAAYEETGLSPEDITKLNDFEHSQCAKLLAENGNLRQEAEKIPVYCSYANWLDTGYCDSRDQCPTICPKYRKKQEPVRCTFDE